MCVDVCGCVGVSVCVYVVCVCVCVGGGRKQRKVIDLPISPWQGHSHLNL